MAYPLPEEVGPVLGALVEPMSVAYRAVLRAQKELVKVTRTLPVLNYKGV